MSKQDTRVKTARREHDAAFKLALIECNLHPGASVSAIALENCINANLLFKWRSAHLRAKVAASAPGARELAGRSAHARLRPVRIEPVLMGVCARMDKPHANTATAHKLAMMVYFMLTRGEAFVDKGQQHYEEQQRQRSIMALKRRAAALGFNVTPSAAPTQMRCRSVLVLKSRVPKLDRAIPTRSCRHMSSTKSN